MRLMVLFFIQLEESSESAVKVSSRLDGETSRVLEQLAGPEDSFAKQVCDSGLSLSACLLVAKEMGWCNLGGGVFVRVLRLV